MPETSQGTCQHTTTTRVGSVGGREGVPIDRADPSIAGLRLSAVVDLCMDCTCFAVTTSLRHPTAGRTLTTAVTTLRQTSGGEDR